MVYFIIWAVLGLLMILLGANKLIDGASAVASRMGVSDLVIGLTVVAMGTSAPELVVSITAALNGSAPMAIGNVVGSNTLNILLVIGLTAMIRPIEVEKSVMSVEIPIVILAAVVLLVLGNSSLLDPGTANVITRVDGIFLLIAFALYMRHLFANARCNIPAAPAAPAAEAEAKHEPRIPLWLALIYLVGGLVVLVWGGDMFVEAATGVAHELGISDAIVGLTVVAVGTSLPELASSIVAAAKGKGDLAIGNVVGSNIFNVFFVLGASSVVHPLPFGGIGNFDLLTCLLASILFLIFGWFIKVRTITRLEGTILFLVYVAYTVALVVRA